MRTRFAAVSLVLAGSALAATLGACSLLAPAVPTTSTHQQDPSDSPQSGPPAGWASFDNCEGGPGVDWAWIDGFPADEFDSTGATADCGDTWPEDDGNTFIDVTAYAMTTDQIDEFGSALEASGYEKLVEDFDPTTPSGESYYGARDYYLDGISDGDFTRLAMEIYPGAEAATWVVYIDYLSPLTRQLS
jgi:hypothetical protein